MKPLIGKTYSIFLITQFLKVFFVTILFIMGLSLIVRTLQGLEYSKAFTFYQVILLRILETPEIISRECLLASCMFASVYTISNLSKNREILALRSCGVSIYRIILPLIFIGFLVFVSSILFEDYIVVRSFVLKDRYVTRWKGEEPVSYYRDRSNVIVFGENNIIYKIDKYSSKNMEMSGIMIIQKDMEGNITYRIDADRAIWDGERWIFYDGILRNFNKDGDIKEREIFTVMESAIKDDPKYFGQDIRRAENMTLREAYDNIKMMKKMGFDYKMFLARFHRKIANSFTLFLVIIIGLSLGSMSFKNALVISFSITIGMVLVFFFIIEIGYTLGSSGKIPTVIGGWLGNIVFFIVGLYLIKKIRV